MPEENLAFTEGLNYRSPGIYRGLSFLKLQGDSEKRFQIAREHIRPFGQVVDLCAGDGRLRDFLPRGCSYHAVDASPGFIRHLQQKNISCTRADLHKGFPELSLKIDTAVIIISFYHFRKNQLQFLQELKSFAAKTVIVEEVLHKARSESSLVQKAMDHLCRSDYYSSAHLFTRSEFQDLMHQTGFTCEHIDHRYSLGVYER